MLAPLGAGLICYGYVGFFPTLPKNVNRLSAPFSILLIPAKKCLKMTNCNFVIINQIKGLCTELSNTCF